MPSGRSRHDHDAELARLVDAAEDGVICFDEHGAVLYANPASSRLLALDSDSIGGHADELPPTLRERVASLLEPGSRCPSRPFSILVGERTLSCRAWRSHAGPRSLAVSLHDDSILVGHRERVEAVLQATTDGLLVLSASDEVTYANPAALKMLHATEHDLIGSHVSVDGLLGLEPVPPPEGGPAQMPRHHELRDARVSGVRLGRPALLADERHAVRGRWATAELRREDRSMRRVRDSRGARARPSTRSLTTSTESSVWKRAESSSSSR